MAKRKAAKKKAKKGGKYKKGHKMTDAQYQKHMNSPWMRLVTSRLRNPRVLPGAKERFKKILKASKGVYGSTKGRFRQ